MSEIQERKRKGGRPKSDSARDETLPEVRLTKEEKRMIQIKALLFQGGNVSAYMRDLARLDQRSIQPLKGCRCGNPLHTVFEDMQQPITIGSTDRTVTIHGVPRNYCQSCNHTHGDLKLEAYLEMIVDDLVETALQEHQPIPVELSFAGMAGLIE